MNPLSTNQTTIPALPFLEGLETFVLIPEPHHFADIPPSFEEGLGRQVGVVNGAIQSTALSHLQARSVQVPEGVLEIHLCQVCGGRKELLIEPVKQQETATTSEPEASGIEASTGPQIQSALRQYENYWDRFTERHADCPSHSRDFQLSSRAQQVVGEVLARTERIAQEETVWSTLFLLDGDRLALVPLTLAFSVQSDDPTEERRQLERFKQAVRHQMQEIEFTPQMAVMVGESYFNDVDADGQHPRHDPEAEEGLLVWLGTREFSRAGVVGIDPETREFQDRGRPGWSGSLDQIKLEPGCLLPWTEGFFAESLSEGG